MQVAVCRLASSESRYTTSLATSEPGEHSESIIYTVVVFIMVNGRLKKEIASHLRSCPKSFEV